MIGSRQRLRVLTIIAAIWALPAAVSIRAATQDYTTSTAITYKIDRDHDSFRLRSETSFRYEYRSELSTYKHGHGVYEPFYARVKGLKAKFNDHKIHKSDITLYKVSDDDLFFPDDAHYSINIGSAIRPGDVYTVRYRMEYDGIEYLPVIYVPNGGYVEEYRVSFEHPEDVLVSFEFFFPDGDIPYTISHPDAKHTELLFSDLPEIGAKPYFAYNDYQAAVMVTLWHDNRRITPTDTDGFLAWYGSMTPLAPTLDSAHQDILAAELQSASNDRERLTVIYDYVRRNIRYLSEGHGGHAFVPHDPSLVLDHKYGDCKDRAYLVSAIARQYGIPVYMALVAVEPSPLFTGIHTSFFDHVICCKRDGDTDFFFDPTERFRNIGGLREEIIGSRAFILDPDNPGYETVTAPFDRPAIDIRIHGNYDSLPRMDATITFRYNYLFSVRLSQRDYTETKLDNTLSENISSLLYKIGLENFQQVNDSGESLTMSADADLSRFIVASTDHRYIPQTAFILASNDMFKREQDTLPIYASSRSWLRLTIDLEAPGVTASADSAVYRDSAVAAYRAIAETGNDHIGLVYEYCRPTKDLAGSNRQKFMDVMQWYKSQKNEMFIISREE